MLTQLFPKYYRRYAQSPVASWLEGFAKWLLSAGYGRDPAHDHVRRLKQVLERCGSVTPDARFPAAALPRLFTSPVQQVLFRGTQRAFERYLAACGRLIAEPQCGRFAELLEAYRWDLVEMRGFAPSTVHHHITTAATFLEQTLPGETVIGELTPLRVEQFVTLRARRLKRPTLQHVVAQLRSFLRFCYERGDLPKRLDAIDTPRTYREELPPKALAWNLVQQLLRSIDRSSGGGWRDYTILYLMAHYGLRPSEVVALRLDSIDWPNKTLRVEQRKTRSALILPLADRTLRVLRHYLHCGRPSSARPELFLRARTPAGPLKHTAVSDIYEKRARQSGLPLQGTSSYCLRHAFAMRLLNRGVGVKAIGDLLGHRSLESTCVYLRLQTEALREVALPVPTLRAVDRRLP